MRKKTKHLKNQWPSLRGGDIIDIVAPASSCAIENLHKGAEVLKSWGFVPRIPKNIFASDVICANTDAERFRQLKLALLATDSAAVWCVRGGYGSNRLVPELAKLPRPKGLPKLFLGYSDVTTIHGFLNAKWNWPTIHGPMLDRIGRGLVREPELAELREILLGEKTAMEFTGLTPVNAAAKRIKKITGLVSGGNIHTLQSAISTRAPWVTKDRILFLEEIDERGYRVDRILEHLRQTGHFAKAKAVVLGDFLGGDEIDGTSRVWPVIERFAAELSIPVVRGVKAGHGDLQKPVPFATPAILQLNVDSCTLQVATGVARVTPQETARSRK